MITVSELIEKLKQYNPDARIVIAGGKGGFDDVAFITELKIALNKNNPKYGGGEHDFPTDDEDSVDAILLKKKMFWEFKIFT